MNRALARQACARCRASLICLAGLSSCAVALGQGTGEVVKQRVIFKDNFRHGLGHWTIDAEQQSHIHAHAGVLDIDAPAGTTVWLRLRLQGALAI